VNQERHEPDWDESADVIVIGGGYAGLAAAIEARLAGASVILLEKMKACGGNSIISGGLIAAAGTPFQERLGITDSAGRMFEDMVRTGLGLNHPPLARRVAEGSAGILRWTIDELGMTYLERLEHMGGHSVPRSHIMPNYSGASLMKKLLARARALGVSIRTGVVMEQLVQDGGQVVGVRVRTNYTYPRADSGLAQCIQARRAVILATGGFAEDLTFRVAQDPRYTPEVETTNKRSTTAEGLREALRIGGLPVQLACIQLGPWTSPDERGESAAPAFADVAFEQGMILHPETGRRLVNELADRKTLADALWATPRPCICFTDSRGLQKALQPVEPALRKGIARRFDSLRTMAEAYGLPAEAVEESVAQYNQSVSEGQDREFGKRIPANAEPLVHPPYFGMRLRPKIHHTMGGVGINEGAQVLDLAGAPIPGLFAAGEVTGGVHGACRLGSCAITECLIFGRIAGRRAAREKDLLI
jgi:flavocytochrome c